MVRKVTVASVKSLFGVEWCKPSLVDSFSNKGLLLNGDSPIIMCLCHFVGTHSWNRKFWNDTRALDGDQITWVVDMVSSFGVLSDIVFIDLVLFSNPNLFPVNRGFDWHEHVSAKDQLSWGEA